MNQVYQLSGKPGSIWVIGLFLGPLLAILISIIYAYIDVYNPLVYLTFLVYIGYLVGIIMIQKLVVRISKCRSMKSSYLYGAVVGLFSIYASWVTFLYVLLQRSDAGFSFIELLSSPGMLYDLASTLSITGWYEIFGAQVSGGLLWVIWIIEAIGILLAGIIGGSSAMHEQVFCENCNKWAEDIKFDLRLSLSDRVAADTAIKEDINTLVNLPKTDGLETPHLKVNIHHCNQCDNLSTVDVDLIRLEKNDKGEVQEKDEDYSPVILITNDLYQQFLLKKKEPLVAPSIARTSDDQGQIDERNPG